MLCNWRCALDDLFSLLLATLTLHFTFTLQYFWTLSIFGFSFIYRAYFSGISGQEYLTIKKKIQVGNPYPIAPVNTGPAPQYPTPVVIKVAGQDTVEMGAMPLNQVAVEPTIPAPSAVTVTSNPVAAGPRAIML